MTPYKAVNVWHRTFFWFVNLRKLFSTWVRSKVISTTMIHSTLIMVNRNWWHTTLRKQKRHSCWWRVKRSRVTSSIFAVWLDAVSLVNDFSPFEPGPDPLTSSLYSNYEQKSRQSMGNVPQVSALERVYCFTSFDCQWLLQGINLSGKYEYSLVNPD